VSDYDRRGATVEAPGKRSLLADLSDRMAKSFSRVERVENGTHPDEEQTAHWDEVVPRFPILRQGYDCDAVDRYVAELEQELSDLDEELTRLRTAPPNPRTEVVEELERIGRETSSILLAAHDKAQETTRAAQAQADRCIADAAANAVAMSEQATQDVRRLEGEKVSLIRERDQILADIGSLADTLSALARRGTESEARAPSA
jgi:ElaB/YqjD/DUF883 family membrane-anchored ribosome-binding protein